MVSKKLTARLEKKQEELVLAESKVETLREEVTNLEQEVRLELFAQLEINLGTTDWSELETFISDVSAKSEEPVELSEPGILQQTIQPGGGF
jgi:hypothetical protein